MDVYVLIGTILWISYSLKRVMWFLKYSWCCGPMDWSEGMCHGSLHGVWWAVPKGAGRSNLQRSSCWCCLPTNEWSLPLGPARLWLLSGDISGYCSEEIITKYNEKTCPTVVKMLNGDAEPYYVGFPLSLGNTQMKKWWGSHAHMNTFDDGNPQWFRWVGQPYVFCTYFVSVSISEFRHVFAKFACDILLVLKAEYL